MYTLLKFAHNDSIIGRNFEDKEHLAFIGYIIKSLQKLKEGEFAQLQAYQYDDITVTITTNLCSLNRKTVDRCRLLEVFSANSKITHIGVAYSLGEPLDKALEHFKDIYEFDKVDFYDIQSGCLLHTIEV